MAKKSLTEREKQEIEAAVVEVEKKTIGEIVPVLVRESDNYPGAKLRCAMLVAIIVAISLYIFLPLIDPSWYLFSLLPGGVVGHFFAKFPWIKRFFLRQVEMDEEVHQRAIQSFFYLDLSSTQDRTGVLLFVSMLERRVEILADRGINQKIQSGAWEGIIANLVSCIQKNELGKGICQAIHEIGSPLEEHFPKTEGNQDQLPNRVIIDI